MAAFRRSVVRYASGPYSPAYRDGTERDSSRRRRVYDSYSESRSESQGVKWAHDKFEGPRNKPGSAVFVRGLPCGVVESDLREWFESKLNEPGNVCFVKIDRAPLTTATVGFKGRDLAQQAVEKCHNQNFHGHVLRLVQQDLSIRDNDARKKEEEAERAQRQRELASLLQGRKVVHETRRRDTRLVSGSGDVSVFDRVS